MRIVVAPDKFKGSLPAPAVAEAIATGLRAASPSLPDIGVFMRDASSLLHQTGELIARDLARGRLMSLM